MKPDYTAFDAALIAHIQAGKSQFLQLEQQADLIELAKPFCNRLTEPFRIIDRRLQSMRKAGGIKYAPKTGWQIATVTLTLADELEAGEQG